MNTPRHIRRRILSSGIALSLLSGPAMAANWLMLQGTEPPDSAGRAKLWGFIQAQYQQDFSDANPGPAGCAAGQTDCYVPPKLIGPDLESQSAFNINRARIGVRGANLPLDNKTNYFLLAEFGNNGITSPGGSFVHVTDASITLNHIPGARFRVGLFKYPGAEEGLQAIHVFDYINFTSVTNQMLLERFQDSTQGSRVGAQALPPAQSLNTFDRPVGAFRDVGIQLFDTFKTADWEHSYAAMIGNGNGLNFSDNNDDKDFYLFWASEKVFGGKGPRREGLKMFGWYHNGTRSFDGNRDGVVENYDRDRYGLGFKYLQKPWRVTGEYMKGEGMIFNGPDKSDFALVSAGVGNPSHPSSGLNAEAFGYYIEGGYYIPNTKWELDARYDSYTRLDGSQFELEFNTLTLGVQYHLNKKTRLTLNYSFSDAEAVNFASGTCGAACGPNNNLDGVNSRVAVQLTAIY